MSNKQLSVHQKEAHSLTNRGKLLKLFTENKVSKSTLEKIADQMREKSIAEKETMAKMFIEKIEAGQNPLD